MAPSTTWLLLMQSLLFSMAERITAERMKMDLVTRTSGKTPAEDLARIFAEKQNSICGSGEIRKELTKGISVGGMRTSNWPKVIKIADEYLQFMISEIPKLTKEVKDLNKKIAEAEADQAFKAATKEDMIQVVTETIEQDSTFINTASALKSKCGFQISAVNGELKKKLQGSEEGSEKNGKASPS
jgi:hypothetical protein